MGLIAMVAAAVFTLLVACVSRLLADELKASMPSVVDRIISFAVSRAPEHLRERLAEEWRGHINDAPGDLGKLFVALGFIWASGKLRNELGHAGIAADRSMRELDDQSAAWAEFMRRVEGLYKNPPERLTDLNAEFMRRVEELHKNPPERLTDLNAYPPNCNAARDGLHNVPGAALYFSPRYGRTFQGPCVRCGQWIDTGETPD
jgi:hypothetical protein